MLKIKNISKDNRKFRIHKTAEAFLIRPGEEIEIPYPLIVDRQDIFKVTKMTELNKEKPEMSERKHRKLNKEDKQ